MAEELDRRSSIIGLALGFIAGGAAGFVGASLRVDPPVTPPAAASSVRAPTGPALTPAGSAKPGGGVPAFLPSYAQQGEDLVIEQLTRQIAIGKPTYLDIGAHDPYISNNTYLLSMLGSQGVLVEPNPVLAEKLRTKRTRDKVLEVGVGVTEQAEADYFMMEGDGQLNTFSKTQVAALERQGVKLEKTIKRKLVPINKILDEHFHDRAPDVLSIDVEGLDLTILKSLDWNRWRPPIICVETADVEDGHVEIEILKFLEGKGYTVRGGSFVNTIFLDEQTWKPAGSRDAGAAEAGAKK